MSHNYAVLRRRHGRAELTLNRPPKNLLNVEMLEEILAGLDPLRDDETLKVLVVRGFGGHFCSGVDLAERTSERAGLLMPQFTRLFDYLNQIRGLTVAMVEGEAFDGGFELAAFCDVVFAADGATFRLPEITYGLFPPIAAALLPRLVGRNKALEYILSGETIKVDELQRAGLVNRIFPGHRVNEELERFVSHVESLSAPAVVWAKRAVDRSLYSPVMEGMRTSESIYMLELMRNLDPHEGVRAALEGRKPVWRNL